ncbi:MAG: exonuclease SbcCD subunit D [Woeseia sp.]
MNGAEAKLRFIHSSDWQLGMTRAFLTPEAASRFSQSRIAAIQKLGELARQHDAAFIVVAGDVFESNQVTRQTLLRAVEALDALPVPVFLLPGNHDPLDGSSIFSTRELREAGDHVLVIRTPEPMAVPGLAGAEVVGAPWRSKRPGSDLCADMLFGLAPAEGILRVAVAHGQVDKLAPDTSRPDIIDLARAEAAVRERRIHYLALGDRHSLTDVGSTKRIWYSGTPVVTAFDETEPNKALLVELDAAGACRVDPLQVGDWKFLALEARLDGPDDLQRIDSMLSELPGKARTAVKIGFKGTVNLATAGRLDELMEARAELFASLRRRERTTDLAIVPDGLDEDSVSLAGYARSAWDELLASAKGGDEAARDALRLFYRLSHQGES